MAAKKNIETIEIKPIEFVYANIKIVGDTPLIVHKWTEKAKKEILDNQTGKAKASKKIKRPVDDFCRSMYWIEGEPPEDATDDEIMEAIPSGRFGFKVTAIKQAAISAAFRSGMSKDKVSLQGVFFIYGNGNSDIVEIKGDKPHMREDMVRVSNGAPDIRYRGEFYNWYMELTIKYNRNGKYSLEQIMNMLNLGGFSCGIGEWRTEKSGQSGMFHVEQA